MRRDHSHSHRLRHAIRRALIIAPSQRGQTMNGKLRPALAELVGTFIFFFIGAGSIVTDSYTHGAVGLIGIALAHGLILSIMVSAFRACPADTLTRPRQSTLWVAKKVDAFTVVTYIIAQLIGGALAGLLRGIFPEAAWQAVHLGTPALAVGVAPISGLILEATLTFFLMIAVLGTAVAQWPENWRFPVSVSQWPSIFWWAVPSQAPR